MENMKPLEAPAAPLLTEMPKSEFVEQKIDAIADYASSVNPRVASCMETTKPAIVFLTRFLMCIGPIYMWLLQWAIAIYNWLPKQAASCIFGLALCFFGGTYVASIAAIEAFRQMGFNKVWDEIIVIKANLEVFFEASKADDAELAKDKDGDGQADIMQMTPAALAQHKTLLFMRAVPEPARLQAAVGALWSAYIAVLATLKLEFARTTAFALGIVEVIRDPVVRVLAPLIESALAMAPANLKLEGKSQAGWAVSIVESTMTLIAVIFAWYLQMVISAFYCGLRGGRMFAISLIGLLSDFGLMQYVPCIEQPFDPDNSHIDEAIGYTVAFFGFSFQFFSGFSLPFPLNVIFLPLTLIEWFLRIQISMSDAGVK